MPTPLIEVFSERLSPPDDGAGRSHNPTQSAMSYTYPITLNGEVVAAASAPSIDKLGSLIVSLCERRASSGLYCDVGRPMREILDEVRHARPTGTVRFDLIEVSEEDGSEQNRAEAEIRVLPLNQMP